MASTSTLASAATSAKHRESGRLQAQQHGRVLDDAAQRRRLKRQLDALELDNFHDDPHANLQWNKKLPKFEDPAEQKDATSSAAGRKRKRMKSEIFKQRFRKTFQAMLEEELIARPDAPNYFSAAAPPSRRPSRKLCAVCGFQSKYTCIKCRTRYCSIKCKGVHEDTRCLKWTA